MLLKYSGSMLASPSFLPFEAEREHFLISKKRKTYLASMHLNLSAWIHMRRFSSLAPKVQCLKLVLVILLKKKEYSMTFLKMVRQSLFRTIVIDVGTTTIGFYSCRERLSSGLNTA